MTRATGKDDPALAETDALKLALIRLLWDSVADAAACSCEPDDVCPQCDAMHALGYAGWVGPGQAARSLRALRRRIEASAARSRG